MSCTGLNGDRFEFTLPEIVVDIDLREEPVGYNHTYGDIAKVNLASLVGMGKKIPFGAGGDYRKFIPRQEAILLDVPEWIKKTASFAILGKAEKSENVPFCVIDKRTWEDLSILRGSGKHPDRYLGSLVHRASTELGKGYLLGTLARPIADQAILKNRQEIVQELVANGQLCNELHDLLKASAAEESQLLSFWNSALQLPGSMNKQYFQFTDDSFLGKTLNRSSVALSLKSGYTNLRKVANAGVELSSSLLLPLFAAWAFAHFAGEMDIPQFLEDYAVRFTGASSSTGPLFSLLLLAKNRVVNSAATLVAGGLIASGLKSTLGWCKADIQSEGLVQNKLVQVAGYYKHMKKVYELLSKNGNLAKKFEHFADLVALMKTEDERLKKLFAMLESNTLSEKAEWFFNRGAVLAAFDLLQDDIVQEQLGKGLNAIAEVDMFLSIANLYKEGRYCFPVYEDLNVPHIKLTDFWNPFVDSEKAVRNNIELGDETRRNAVITGPNSGGKSTAMNGIGYQIILAQSLGIAPSSEMRFTPFSHVATYMDITDDISDKTSLFQCEIDRALKLQETIEKLGPHRFSFSMFDELFSGTSPDEGRAIAYAVAEKLGENGNSISMIATHYPLLTDLEKNTDNFSNYKVSVERLPGQKIVRKYKLELGISDQHIALDVAKERGTNHRILERASEILSLQHT